MSNYELCEKAVYRADSTGEGDEGDTHDSLERKAKQITSVSLEESCPIYIYLFMFSSTNRS